jgi:hypothetical protein
MSLAEALASASGIPLFPRGKFRLSGKVKYLR